MHPKTFHATLIILESLFAQK